MEVDTTVSPLPFWRSEVSKMSSRSPHVMSGLRFLPLVGIATATLTCALTVHWFLQTHGERLWTTSSSSSSTTTTLEELRAHNVQLTEQLSQTSRQLNCLQATTLDELRARNVQLTEQLSQTSRQLNRLQASHQKLVCDLQNRSGTSQTGGWCNKAVHSDHVTDAKLAKALSVFFANKSIVGLGDGIGKYRELILDDGKVRSYDAFDGSPHIVEMTSGKVQFLDLTLPQYWLPKYDWVVSLEVIEHIPEEHEATVLDNVARAAGEGVVLSWAVPGQGGFHHVNNQPLQHVVKVMSERGFTIDDENSQKLRETASLPWLRNNVNVFRRNSTDVGR